MTDSKAPVWPLAVVLVQWVGFLVLWPGTNSDQTVQAGFAGLLVLASLPILWYDARKAKASGQLEVSYPVLVPLAILLLWFLTAPAYVCYRAYTHYSDDSAASAGA